jgi:phage RecT family recombinase
MSNIVKAETFDPVKSRVLELGVKEETFLKEASFAAQAINGNSQLQKSTDASKLMAVLNVAQIGLSLNPVKKESYLVPRFNRGSVECQLEPSYQGLVKLLTDTGSVKSMAVYGVREGDEFEVELGTEMKVTHKPKFKSQEITHVYGIATLPDGGQQIEIMTADEINAIRDLSESYKAFKAGKIRSCVWVDHYNEMARKTLIRRFYKYLPKSDAHEQLQQAIALDESDYLPSYEKIDVATSLLQTSAYEGDQYAMIEAKINGATNAELDHIISDLKQNQVDAIDAGRNYSQTDIKDKLK